MNKKVLPVVAIEIFIFVCVCLIVRIIFTDINLVAGIASVVTYTFYDMLVRLHIETKQ